MPWTVTITGADDAVDPLDLANLSANFPFVEWAILFSKSREGTPRYPSLAWRHRFATLAAERGMRVAAHLCGAWARDFMDGRLPALAAVWQRVQLNGVDVQQGDAIRAYPGELILQCRSEADLPAVAEVVRVWHGPQRTSVLFDPSGGRGLEPFRWPVAPLGVRMGYAGGIGPDNVRDVLAALGPVEPTWIDMESGVRGEGDVFSLHRVCRVLEQVASMAEGRR